MLCFKREEYMGKLAVKYLDPETGEYKYATVVDVGDLTKLKTTVKSDLVSAINSIEITGELPADVQNQLDEINQNINDIQSGVLTESQVAGINQKITEGINSLVIEVGELNVKINDDIVKAKNELLGDMDQNLENVENDYNSKIGVISGSLDGAKADIDSVESDLINVGTKLQTVETNYTKVSSDIDIINGELSTKVNSSDFNLMESKVSQNITEINQTKEDISLLATKSSLDLTTDRVIKAESDIKINADGLSSRVTYTELNEQLDNASKYGDNILRGTRNWDSWETNNIAKAYISNDTYRHCKIQVVEDKQYYYETELDSLEVGKTYIASIYFKTKVESDYASVNIDIGSESIPLDNLVEDTLILNGWKRVSANFVASDVKTKVSFRFSFLDTNNIGYLVASKIETGIKPSEWKSHFDDDNESIIKNETLIKQNSDSIVSLVSSTEKLGEDIETANTQITQTAESLSLQAQKITDIEGEVSENKASIVLANNKIETKVSQTDVDKSISDIDLDTKNRIINSDFSRGFSNWSEINSGFTIKEISGVNYAHIDRSGLINVSIASMASDKFPAKNGDKLVFSLDFMTESISSLDDKTIMTIELFNINDTRVFSKTFNLGDFNVSIVDNVITRISSKYIVDREDVAKARLKIQLNKNGSVNFSKISLQKGDLKEKEWLLAPEDIQLLKADLQTSINQNADNIELKATKTELDTTNNAVKENKASIEVANNAISQKVSSTDVEGILSEKAYATKSELTQTSNSLTSTISGVQTNLNNLTLGGVNILATTTDAKTFQGKGINNQWAVLSYLTKTRLADYNLKVGDKVSFSCICEISGSNFGGVFSPRLRTSWTTLTQNNANYSITKAETIKFTCTFIMTESRLTNGTGVDFRADNVPSTVSMKWSEIQLEVGDKPTGYAPAPEEKANQIQVTQLSQDLSGFKTTVSNTYLSKSDASGTYADKVSVASQITQSATAVTSNIQSWTNNKLTAYSTTQQTATSITNAVADKADKSQITQLSDSINLKVSKGDVVSSINQEAGQILFNSNKLVLNANTTEIAGDAFIRGDMIVDKSITAEKIEVDTLASISANIGDIRAGSITGINILSSSITNVYDFDYNGVRHSGLVSLKDGFNVEDFAEISGKTKYGKVNMIGGGYNTGLNIQEYPDVKDVNSFKMVWVTADGIYFQDSINNLGGSITAENVTLVPWTNLILKSGYKAGDGAQPQYRRIKNLDGSYTVQFRGAISATSGNFPTTQVQVVNIPEAYRPPSTAMRQGSAGTTNATTSSATLAMTPSGNLHITAAINTVYIYLDALTYVN